MRVGFVHMQYCSVGKPFTPALLGQLLTLQSCLGQLWERQGLGAGSSAEHRACISPATADHSEPQCLHRVKLSPVATPAPSVGLLW